MDQELKSIDTAAEVIEALGGKRAVAELCGFTHPRASQTVSNWVVRSFPAENFDLMFNALKARGYTAPKHLWRQLGHPKPAEQAVEEVEA